MTMKQLLLTAVAAFLTTSSVWAQRPSGYLTDEISAPTSNAASRSAAIYDM